jgi:DNA-directed RNA polymerase specialized sigma24 family protein
MTPDFSTPDARAVTIVAIVDRLGKIPIDLRSEVAQRTYLRIVAKQPPNLTVTYVRKIAWNIFLDLLREDKRRTAAETEAERRPSTQCDPQEKDSIQCIDEPYRSMNIIEEVDALPRDLRTVMQRSIIGDTPAEIATALSLPPGTVRWRLRQARLRIARGLGLSYGKRSGRCCNSLPSQRRQHASWS